MPQVAESIGGAEARVLAVGSGKGGVGKSTISLNLALALADSGRGVGLLDADVYGPNIPLLVNLRRSRPTKYWTLASVRQIKIEPVERFGLKIMSTGFIAAEDQALVWESDLVKALLSQFVRNVEWGELDYLVVDLPPGTATVAQTIMESLPLRGAILVVTPQDVAHIDARRALQMFRQRQVPVLGAVENMRGVLCPCCGETFDVFLPVAEARSLFSEGISKLGSIPLDPEISRLGDRGSPVMVAEPESPQAAAFREIAAKLEELL